MNIILIYHASSVNLYLTQAKNNVSEFIFGIDIRHHIIILDLYFNAVKYNEYKYLFLFTIKI